MLGRNQRRGRYRITTASQETSCVTEEREKGISRSAYLRPEYENGIGIFDATREEEGAT